MVAITTVASKTTNLHSSWTGIFPLYSILRPRACYSARGNFEKQAICTWPCEQPQIDYKLRVNSSEVEFHVAEPHAKLAAVRSSRHVPEFASWTVSIYHQPQPQPQTNILDLVTDHDINSSRYTPETPTSEHVSHCPIHPRLV